MINTPVHFDVGLDANSERLLRHNLWAAGSVLRCSTVAMKRAYALTFFFRFCFMSSPQNTHFQALVRVDGNFGRGSKTAVRAAVGAADIAAVGAAVGVRASSSNSDSDEASTLALTLAL